MVGALGGVSHGGRPIACRRPRLHRRAEDGLAVRDQSPYQPGEFAMKWTKPEFEVVEVTMEVTAYVARR